jgi:dihydroflavonol-4-reductase
MAMKMARVKPTLVTGATGFVGSAVARALGARGHQIRVLVRSTSNRRNLDGFQAEIVFGDINDPTSVARAMAGCRYVIHLAADYRIWVPKPEQMMKTNVEGTANVMRAAKAAGVERIVHCSSVAALAMSKDGTPTDEDTPIDPDKIVGSYKRSKYLGEQAVRELMRELDLPVVIVNPAAPVGMRDIKPTPTGRMIVDAANGKIPAYMDTGLNLVRVDDVAIGHVLALERGRIGEGYILGGENLSLREILTMVTQEAGRKPPWIKVSPNMMWPVAMVEEWLARVFKTEPRVTRDHLRMARSKMYFSSAKAMRELGYAPRPVRPAIKEAVAWFLANGMVVVRE